MKNAIVITALCLGLNTAFAQQVKESEVPALTKEGFKRNFPTAKVEKWEKEGANFEAEFDVNKVETSALFDTNGALLETEVEIAVKDLPKNATDYLSKNVAGKKIKESAKITNNKGLVSYEAEVDGADYIFDSMGNFIKKEVEKNDKDDDKKEKK